MQPGLARSPDAFRDALETLHPASFAWALSCCHRNREVAADVLQRAYEKVLSQEARWNERSSLKTWLFGVILRTAQDHRRREWFRRTRDVLFGIGNEVDNGKAPDSAMREAKEHQVLHGALVQLAPRQREVIALVFQQDLSIAEAAAVMGVTLGSASVHYDRGKKKLLELLAREGIVRT